MRFMDFSALSNQSDIMPYNLLQAYSQDAYLKGNEAYSGNAQNIPEPPPICYPRIEVKAAGMAQTSEPATVGETPRGSAQGAGRRGGAPEKSYRVEIPVPPSPPPPQTVVCVCSDNVRTVAVSLDPVDRGSRVARAGPSHRTEENRYGSSAADSGSARPRPLIPSVPGGAQLQYPSSRPAESPAYSPSGSRFSPIYPDKLSPPVRTPLSPASPDTFSTSANHYSPPPAAPSTSQHQNIDWKNYTTYKDYIDAKRLHTYGCRTIQERLDSLRAAASSSSAYAQQRTPPPPSTSQRGALGSQVKRRSTSTDRGVDANSRSTAGTPLRSASQERLGGGTDRAPIRNWPRSASENALPFSSPAGVTKPRARSCDYLGQKPGEPVGSACGERVELEDRLLLSRGEEARASRQGPGLRALPHLNRSVTGHQDEGRGSGLSSSPLVAPVFTKGTTDSVLTPRTDSVILRPSRLPVKNSTSDPSPALSSVKTTDPLKDQRANMVANHLGYASPLHLQLRGRADSLKMESRSEAGLAARSSSCSGPSSKLSLQRHLQSVAAVSPPGSSTTNGDVSQKPNAGAPVRTNGSLADGVEGPDATVVVLRKDKNSGLPHVRPPSYVLAVNDNQRAVTHKSPPLVKAGSADGAMCWNSCRERSLRRPADTRHKSASNNLDDSLDSIPFIGKTLLVCSELCLFPRQQCSKKLHLVSVCSRFVDALHGYVHCVSMATHFLKERPEVAFCSGSATNRRENQIKSFSCSR